MKLNSKGQVTIPADLRHRHGFMEGDEVDVVEDGDTLRIVHRISGPSRGARIVTGCGAERAADGPRMS